MDDATIDYVLSASEIDHVSGVPVASVVFMLYYGLELKHFLMDISDEFIKKYPLKQHHVGTSSMYLSGSAAQGLYLNTKYLPEARDIDIVTINRKYDIRERCNYRDTIHEQAFSLKMQDNRENDQICERNSNINGTTCEYEDKYLNIKVLPETPTGYVLLEKCRRQPLPVQTIDDVYVSSLKTTEARVQYWHDMKPFIRQWFEKFDKDSSLFSYIKPHGPAATAYMSGFETTTPFEVDMVFCVPYPMPWPNIAEEWLHRQRPSGWPPKSLIDEIYTDGCTLIPKGSVGSPMEDYEWRISFTGDLKLARSLSTVQRELLHILKAVISGSPEAHELSGVVTSVESYQFLNLIYYESEQLKKDTWSQRNSAKLLFHLLEKYLKHFENRHMSHYFIRSRNIFAKFETMSEEELDTVLYSVLRIRRDPLGQLLHQSKYLRLPHSLHENVYSPFVEHVKAFGNVQQQMYVMTLVRLSKAHILEEFYSSANIYANQALKFYNKMTTDTLSDEEYIDLMYTAALSFYFKGSADQVLEYLEQLYLVLHTKSQAQLIKIFGRASYVQLLMIYARSLITSLQNKTRKIKTETVVRTAKRMYQEARLVDPSNLAVIIDMLNTFLHLDDIEELHSIIKSTLPQFSELSVLLSSDNNWSKDTSIDNAEKRDFEIIYDRAEYMRLLKETENIDLHNEKRSTQGKQGQLYQTALQDLNREIQSPASHLQESTTGFETSVAEKNNGFQRDPVLSSTSGTTTSVDPDQQSLTEMQTDILTEIQTEIVVDRETVHSQPSQVPETKFSTKFNMEETFSPEELGSSYSEEIEEVIYDRQQFLESEELETEFIPFTTDDVNMIDADLFTEYCRIQAFRDLNLNDKAVKITESLKEKIAKERKKGEKVSMKMLESAYDVFYPCKQQNQETNDVFHDILSKEDIGLVYSKADTPLLDEVTKCIFHSDDSTVARIPVELAFLNVVIRYHKTAGNILVAREVLSKMESLVEDISYSRDKSAVRYLLACHLDWFSESGAAREMFIQSRMPWQDLSVAEQVSQWFSQMFSIVTALEPKNQYLDEIFNV